MNYRVFWSPETERALASLTEASDDKEALAAAAEAIDRRLVTDPFDYGESREGRVRIAFEPPLAITFEILRDASTVIVHDVWQPHKNR
jgi:hypothetical protein